MIRTDSIVAFVTFALTAFPAAAWDYTTSDPCDTPVETTPAPDVEYQDGRLPAPPISTAIELYQPERTPLSDPSRQGYLGNKITVGNTLITPEGAYTDILGEETTPSGATAPSNEAATTPPATPGTTKCK